MVLLLHLLVTIYLSQIWINYFKFYFIWRTIFTVGWCFAHVPGKRSCCVMQSLASLCRDKREAILVSPPLLVIATAMGQTLRAPTRWYQSSNGLVQTQTKLVWCLREGKLRLPTRTDTACLAIFKQTRLREAKFWFITEADGARLASLSKPIYEKINSDLKQGQSSLMRVLRTFPIDSHELHHWKKLPRSRKTESVYAMGDRALCLGLLRWSGESTGNFSA